jgi:hypothetical protein
MMLETAWARCMVYSQRLKLVTLEKHYMICGGCFSVKEMSEVQIDKMFEQCVQATEKNFAMTAETDDFC